MINIKENLDIINQKIIDAEKKIRPKAGFCKTNGCK